MFLWDPEQDKVPRSPLSPRKLLGNYTRNARTRKINSRIRKKETRQLLFPGDVIFYISNPKEDTDIFSKIVS